jgi:2-amino-4-hydroxy-6-hydroxymethyldihydropteridine diphosphokinase
MTVVYIGLGSNMDRPQHQVTTALAELAHLPDTTLLKASRLYRSAPLGPQDQPDYINAVASVETTLTAETLLDVLQQIEQQHRRVRTTHWGPRTLDLDILLYGNMSIRTPRLTVPHPEMARRCFVLEPLLEINPEVDIPGLGPAIDLYRGLQTGPLQKVDAL